MSEKDKNKEEDTKQSQSSLLERYLQKNMTDSVRKIDDELIAKAIKTLLHDSQPKNKHLN